MLRGALQVGWMEGKTLERDKYFCIQGKVKNMLITMQTKMTAHGQEEHLEKAAGPKHRFRLLSQRHYLPVSTICSYSLQLQLKSLVLKIQITSEKMGTL